MNKKEFELENPVLVHGTSTDAVKKMLETGKLPQNTCNIYAPLEN